MVDKLVDPHYEVERILLSKIEEIFANDMTFVNTVRRQFYIFSSKSAPDEANDSSAFEYNGLRNSPIIWDLRGESSERTNETVEIAIRFRISEVPNYSKWRSILFKLQLKLNALTSATTGYPPHEIIYGMKLNTSSDILIPKSKSLELTKDAQNFLPRNDLVVGISIAWMAMKCYYDTENTLAGPLNLVKRSF